MSESRWTRLTQQGQHTLCRCSCGTVKLVRTNNLNAGVTKSCGCLKCDTVRKHGMSRSRTYKCWENMWSRVSGWQPACAHRYVTRGITVCERWKKFENFLADMGEAPTGLTLDRMDNDRGYSKANCRWATRKEQTANREISRRRIDG